MPHDLYHENELCNLKYLIFCLFLLKELNNNSAINSMILTMIGPECYHHITVAKYGQLFKCYIAFQTFRQSAICKRNDNTEYFA